MTPKAEVTTDIKITSKVSHQTYVKLKTYCAVHRVEMKEVINDVLADFLSKQSKNAAPAVA